MHKVLFIVALLGTFAMSANNANASSDGAPALQKMQWSFDGIGGEFDRKSIRRGLQVYREVCSSCHSLRYIAYRNLAEIGLSEDQIKEIAAEASVQDGPDSEGEMFERDGRPSDYFSSPFPNDKAAAAANNGAIPPDLSLMAKARMDGPNYIYSLMTGYHDDAPEGVELADGMSYNPYFPGGHIAMAPPLYEEAVEYEDGTEASIDQMAKDITNFLQWTAEPEMEERKSLGIKVLLYLLIFTILFHLAKKRVWARLKK